MPDEIPEINSSKAVFDDIYNMSDPRGYFSILGALDYMIPDVAAPVIRQILSARAALYPDPCTVLDIGCSYGINAAVHRFPVDFAGLHRRYARREMMEVAAEGMIALDRNFYAGWPDVGLARFIGLDMSARAIGYADETKLHIGGIAKNLEAADLSVRDRTILAPVNILLSTGAIGYVTDRTYRKLLDALPTPPWIISFVLRMFPYDGFIAAFAERDMVTERLTGTTFVQRRFRDSEEFEKCLAGLTARGIDTRDVEANGLFEAELFLSRPRRDAESMPIEDIVTVSSGQFSSRGARYVQIDGDDGVQVAIAASRR